MFTLVKQTKAHFTADANISSQGKVVAGSIWNTCYSNKDDEKRENVCIKIT